MTTKYYVIAIRWDDELKKQIEYIAGKFETYSNARIFRDAYNNYYHTNAIITEIKE